MAILPTTEVVEVSHGDNPGDDVSHHSDVAGQGSVGPDVADLGVLPDIFTIRYAHMSHTFRLFFTKLVLL